MPDKYKKQIRQNALFKYTQENMNTAIRDFRNKKGSLRDIENKYGVPKTTLFAKVRQTYKKTFGGQLELHPEVEQNLFKGLQNGVSR